MEQHQFRKLINLIESVDRKNSIQLNEAFSAEVILNGIAADIGTPLDQTYAQMQNMMQTFSKNIKLTTLFNAARIIMGGASSRWMYKHYHGKMQEDLYYLAENYPKECDGLYHLLDKYLFLENKMDPDKPRKVSLNVLSEEMPAMLMQIGEAFGHRDLVANAERWKNHAKSLVNMYAWYDANDRLSKPKVYAKAENKNIETIISDATKTLEHAERTANPTMVKSLGLDLERFATDDGIDRLRKADPKPVGPTPKSEPAPFPDSPSSKPGERKTAQDYLPKPPKNTSTLNLKRPTVDKDGNPIAWDEKGNAITRPAYLQQTAGDDGNPIPLDKTGKADPNAKSYQSKFSTRHKAISSTSDKPPTVVPATPEELADVKKQQNRTWATTRQTAKAQADTVDELIGKVLPVLQAKLPPSVAREIFTKVATSSTKLMTLHSELQKRGLAGLLEPEKSNIPTPVSRVVPGAAGPARRVATDKPAPASAPVYTPVDRSEIKSAPRAGASSPYASNKSATPAEPTKVIFKRKAPPPINPSK